MNLSSVKAIFAQAGTTTQQDPTGQLITTIGMFAIMGVMFYLLLIRPQQKRAKELAKLVDTLKPGDKVVTNSGIVGIVVSVKDKTVAIRSAETKLEVLKSTVAEITGRDGDASAA
ncbi:MAG TPA: preprotein translocase subunit YajC [Dongiaceae bacterium]|jgi:preprotein translocase subunit YajC|nr:preprotein translocase subunit YajC [Dongiaceae bacterium]